MMMTSFLSCCRAAALGCLQALLSSQPGALKDLQRLTRMASDLQNSYQRDKSVTAGLKGSVLETLGMLLDMAPEV